MNGSTRLNDIKKLYRLLGELACKHPPRLLSKCSGYDKWPSQGVYFFYECGEYRSGSGDGYRIVRVGTHALKTGSKKILWKRLYDHKSGNKTSSSFRKLVGYALEKKKKDKKPLKQRVTETLGNMWVLCLRIEDEAGPNSLRGYIERNAIALLSNYCECPTGCQCPIAYHFAIDLPSKSWLGYHCVRKKVRRSGLWNQKHVDDIYDSRFLDTLEDLIINL